MVLTPMSHTLIEEPTQATKVEPDPLVVLMEILERHGIQSPDDVTWKVYDQAMRAIEPIIGAGHVLRYFNYTHKAELQSETVERLRKDYTVRLAYTEWGSPLQPTLLLTGGIASAARRFDYLARGLSKHYHVLCLDWAGRGRSGWLAEQADYSFENHAAQVMALIRHKRLSRVTLIGSSLGGCVALRVAAEAPGLVDRLVLNDTGPFIPNERRRRRAESVARHYVFRDPSQMFHRSGASQKNDGPVDDTVLMHNSFHQTHWSNNDQGRIYRHDIRAMQRYRDEATSDHDQWDDWQRIDCPILLVHGMLTDAMLESTIERMMVRPRVSIIHVPDAGHTPTLSDPIHIELLRRWLEGPDDWPKEMTTSWTPRPERFLFR
jgi:pimeloyl-ACP methyl ester carboxylesterase